MAARGAFLALITLLQSKNLSEGSSRIQEVPSPEKSTCAPWERVRSRNILHLGNGDKASVLLLEFQLSNLTSSLSSFDFRTYDSEGIIFYGDIDGPGSWFLLALRQSHLEIQMSNEDGQMMLSQWGPNMSDGKWRKVSVDRNANTIEVKVDGEIVINLMHYLRTRHIPLNHTRLRIVLGDLVPDSTIHLLRPLRPALDGCMRNWSWVKKEARALSHAMETNEHRRCFEHEEHGSYFPGFGFAQFEAPLFLKKEDNPKDGATWGLSIEVSFRPVSATGILFAVQGQNDTTAFSLAMDQQEQAFKITLFDKQFSKEFPVDFCVGHWQSILLKLLNGQLVLETPTIQATWRVLLDDFEALKSVWFKSTTAIYIGGTPDSSMESSNFTGCLKMLLQGKQVDLELAKNKYEHIRTHSCPTQ
ncbi:vitamin K-dependent protein S-like isoform X1 [Rhinatrema bivittatum]|uniref:vitamin K-dependent protein S-like isoform X1 n=1 Tax=Rhinatrema bivittatum TaxID=194408 RepID=UPI00112C99F2|nr:vitamin K-dependent protein S-like isoform X1 [Rhinatrema bivittatum]